jgi:hypothetical protein
MRTEQMRTAPSEPALALADPVAFSLALDLVQRVPTETHKAHQDLPYITTKPLKPALGSRPITGMPRLKPLL